jgi:valyl-tRNA synthetase
MNLEPQRVNIDLCLFFKKENLDIVNRWILSRFYSILKKVNKNLATYRFNEVANTLYSFFWHEFCDWYLEMVKPILIDRERSLEFTNTQIVMYKILEKFLRLMHPFMPFISEEIWQRLPHQGSSIMTQPWPHLQEKIIDKKLEKEIQVLFNLVTQIRNLRSSLEIKPDTKLRVSLYPHTKTKGRLIRTNAHLIQHLAKIEELLFLDSSTRPEGSISDVARDVDIYLHYAGLWDINAERTKIQGKIMQLEKIKIAKENRIRDKEFLKKAPPEVVGKEKKSIEDLHKALRQLEKMQSELR